MPTPDWLAHYLPTRTPPPFISPLPFPDAPLTCSVPVTAVTGEAYLWAALVLLLLALALVLWCCLRQNTGRRDE